MGKLQSVTDIEGGTQHWEERPDETSLLAGHEELLRTVIGRANKPVEVTALEPKRDAISSAAAVSLLACIAKENDRHVRLLRGRPFSVMIQVSFPA